MDVAFLEDLCDICAPVMIEGFHSDRKIVKTSGNQQTTSTDLRVNDMLYERLLRAGFQESEIISEEMSPPAVSSGQKPRWIIDPLDGTHEFIAGVPEFALSIAYLDDSGTAAGAVCNPVKPFRVVGVVGSGLFVNSRPKGAVPANGTVLCSRSEYSKGLLANLERRVRIQPVGSVAYKLGLVSIGLARACISYEGKHSWDIAAGVFLVELAGGVATTLSGTPFRFDTAVRRFEDGLIGCATPGAYWNLYDTLFECKPG